MLCAARGLVAAVPFGLWRASLGPEATGVAPAADPAALRRARQLAAHVRRAALRLPFELKCLPRAMALAWMLRARSVPYTLRLAIRPDGARGDEDRLHAWVECGGEILVGELPGPWIVTFSRAG